ncbi:MAG: GTP 3',8-cyclase MoaA [Deltaproteobacteria bacterium]|nr:GTP 3',8-cyclase MoaA [Myxococcales bacterium]MDP3219398.1 GTP 3',8-cyclase MoaA [Deltaproteobacteria bacterium]
MHVALPMLRDVPAPRPGVTVERASARLVRISLTDRCDMACVYCRPSERGAYLPADERLSVAQWEAVLRGLLAEGVRRVRITGGEPLLHRDVVEVVRRVAALGVDDLALTTNASRLAALAGPLRAAGLRRVTVSIDSLDPARFAAITRGGDLAAVLAGVDAALSAGFDEVKTNTVVLRGVNDHELPALVRWAWARGVTPRLIELMGVGEGGKIWRESLVPRDEMVARLGGLVVAGEGARDDDRGPAKYLLAADGSGRRVGFITGSTDTYCAGCDRLRVTSEGTVRPCLATNDGVELTEAGKAGEPGAVAATLREAWAQKPDASWRGCTEVTARAVSMIATGG